jgi:2-phosphosulfolactate phosphatase
MYDDTDTVNTDTDVEAPWGQRGYGVRFEWGISGARAVPGACYVVVDVLSFTTAVSVAVEAGTAVYPYQWRDDSAPEYAQRVGAVLAAGRRATTSQARWTLSPAALRDAPAAPALVLPSPNGSTITAALAGKPVVAACLRNAAAAARHLTTHGYGTSGRPIVVIAAGERWPAGHLRPAIEDLLGAGAVIDALGDGLHRSPEAETARTCYTGTSDPTTLIRACASGIELIQAGFPQDLTIACELNTSDTIPTLTPDPHGYHRFTAWQASTALPS